jgi:hypothetical protein
VEFWFWKKESQFFVQKKKEHHLFMANRTLFWDRLITFELKTFFSSFSWVLFRTSNFRPYLKKVMLRLILSILNVKCDVGEYPVDIFLTYHCSVQSIHEHVQWDKSKVEVARTAIWSAAHDTR